MQWISKKPILLIPLLLLAAFFLLPLLDEEKKASTKQVSVAEKFPSTGFADYDLLPTELKKHMEELVQEDTLHMYRFAYFFEVDDINRHYFLDDNPENMIVASMPVEKKETLALVDERLAENHRGYSMQFHPENQWISSAKEAIEIRKIVHRRQVEYIFPTAEADFRHLRVGILKDTVHSLVYRSREKADSNTYRFQDVEQAPVPVRGMEYFHNVLRQYLEEELVYFSFYNMAGVVKAEFTIGTKTSSPQIIEGFSTREEDRDEAYKLDGLIVKALNEPKVRWRRGIKTGKKVNTRVSMTFNFAFEENGKLNLSMSELYPATKSF
ncbi:MAG: hypothetical protein ACLFUB_20285 [Cyclobacteriaceae bacterium]